MFLREKAASPAVLGELQERNVRQTSLSLRQPRPIRGSGQHHSLSLSTTVHVPTGPPQAPSLHQPQNRMDDPRTASGITAQRNHQSEGF